MTALKRKAAPEEDRVYILEGGKSVPLEVKEDASDDEARR